MRRLAITAAITAALLAPASAAARPKRDLPPMEALASAAIAYAFSPAVPNAAHITAERQRCRAVVARVEWRCPITVKLPNGTGRRTDWIYLDRDEWSPYGLWEPLT